MKDNHDYCTIYKSEIGEEIRLPVIKKKKTNSKRQFKPEVSQE